MASFTSTTFLSAGHAAICLDPDCARPPQVPTGMPGRWDTAGDGPGDMASGVRRVRAGDTLYGEGTLAEAFYFVRSGTFKTFTTGEDGYEQVLGFVGRGEALALDAIAVGRHTSEAIALEDSSVHAIALRTYLAQEPRNRTLDEAVLRAFSRALVHRGELACVMAAVAAEVRLARFLAGLSEQMRSTGQSPRAFHLRMSRRDIASYLGVAIETLSRSFAALTSSGLITVHHREVEILDMPRLMALATGTRRAGDDGARLRGASRARPGPGGAPSVCSGAPLAAALH